MAFTVVLDTCVLYPAHLRDSLLRFAERGLYRAQWSEAILIELERNLVKAGVTKPAIDHLLDQMRLAFPNANIKGYLPLIPAMTCDDKDRHVLAAAVRSEAAAIVTFNTNDFPDESVDPFEVEVIHPDPFLLDLLDLSPRTVIDELGRQAVANRRKPKSVPALLDALARAGVPQFADEVRRRQ
ncbi:PIN domain-containing protein [Candidatus Poriferisocius sp.]|uniref:PIN domain-containing protein n=1 Tax=Candidatus Poriferisocius sp. TaxID=3101276 RepID=UPI003B5A2F04